ncbi:Fic family protein [Mucilaginibacter sp. BT774]|uniref:Fic family protein n=1 Tax=Mucilaginibacter sp. BT774 TaxID=3062276 RepID=UPI0026776583|nr:Fic family protein [Mucilaginibacter sp. BT774]MDO3628251.1 Fic family protein [Mucilaginibacter sp. BT774]
MHIHTLKQWPDLTWQDQELSVKLGAVRHRQGKILGQMNAAGFKIKEEAILKTLTLDVTKSSEIEGEILNPEQVRSSIARRLGLDVARLIPTNHYIEGVVEMMLDATQNYKNPLTEDRLFGWQSALFPTGRSGIFKIKVGNWRNDEKGPMQVISGASGREKVHYEAPEAERLPVEMTQFLQWFNSSQEIDAVIKAGVAHLWFVTIHPFEDGNGRITRAITDMQLARADGSEQRFYSMSAQIEQEKRSYYDILEKTQKGSLDITEWLLWFLECLDRSMDSTDQIVGKVQAKDSFWKAHEGATLNGRQLKMINLLLEDFYGTLNVSKWAKINQCSTDTALRDIQDLVKKNILEQETAGGRSTSYRIVQV